MHNLLDLESAYLLSSFGQTTATELATLLSGDISDHKIPPFSGKQPPHFRRPLENRVKPYVRQIQSADAAVILDDSIAEKPFTDE